MTHYDALGVRRSASDDEIRRAYLRLARDHHPDRHAGATPEVRQAAEQRMRSINEAWSQLGDPGRRRHYDATLDRSPSGAVVEEEGPSTWRPYDDGWELDDLADLEESDGRRPSGGRLLAMVPAVTLFAGVVLFGIGVVMRARPLLAVGAAGVAIGLLLFVGAPFLVILESRRRDRL